MNISFQQLVHLSDTLTDEQRNLLSVAYKNVVGQRRSAWRITKAMEERNQDKGDEKSEELARGTYRVLRLNNRIVLRSN